MARYCAMDVYFTAPAAATTLPIVLTCWFSCPLAYSGLVIMAIADSTVNNMNLVIQTYKPVAGAAKIRAYSVVGGSEAYAETTIAYTTNKWHHVFAIFEHNGFRAVLLDGENQGNNQTTQSDPAGLNATGIGVNPKLNPTTGLHQIAEAAVYQGAYFNAADIMQLARGCSPLRVKTQALKAYWPLIRGSEARKGEFVLTPTGDPTVEPHPAIRYPSAPHIGTISDYRSVRAMHYKKLRCA